ncbi:MAG: hypothetical protein IT318_27340 [Anaerolineales bacterium]|nr:hypothetical protein [Anaerolineales bacterium]
MGKSALGLFIVALFMLAIWSLVKKGAARQVTTMPSVQGAANLKGIASLDVFSGRPNPTWELSDTTITALVTELDQLKTTPSLEGPDPDSRLGYRGFVVELTDQTSGATRQVAIYLGGIVETGMQTTFYVDPDRKTEKLLLESAHPHIDSSLYTYVEAEINQ